MAQTKTKGTPIVTTGQPMSAERIAAIKALLEREDRPQTWLARRISVSYSYWMDILRGVRDEPTYLRDRFIKGGFAEADVDAIFGKAV